jgi:hypothetical protein
LTLTSPVSWSSKSWSRSMSSRCSIAEIAVSNSPVPSGSIARAAPSPKV